MAFLPSNPHFAFVNFKIGDLELTPIPPKHLVQFNYERTSKTGQGNKILITVFDETAIQIEAVLAQHQASDNEISCQFYYGYSNGNQTPVYNGRITQYDPDFDSGGVSLSMEGVSLGLAEAIADPKSIAYKNMLISDIVKAEADANGWYYDDTTIETTAPVLESKEYSISTTLGGFDATTDTDLSNGGSVNDGSRTGEQQAVLDACNSTPTTASGYCAAWVTNVFKNAQIGEFGGNACDMYDRWCTFSDKSQLKPGMIVACHPSGATGNSYGHVGIYVGNENVMHSTGSVLTSNLDEWINTFGPNGKHKGGQVKWGWLGGVALA